MILNFHACINGFGRKATRQGDNRIKDYSAEDAATTRSKQSFRESIKAENSDIVTGSISNVINNNEDAEVHVDHLDSNHNAEPTLSEEKSHDEAGSRYFLQDRNVKDVNCKLIIDGNQKEIRKANKFGKRSLMRQENLSDGDYINMTRNCSKFIQRRGYIMSELTQEEAEFPIAYSILMFKDVEQVEHLLRTIYRPQHIYCIHVDKKSALSIYRAMKAITSCFNNVFISAKRVRVTWGYFEVLEPDLNCMEELLQRHKKWKYFINLTGQEFPLRTNYELVRILKAYDGANDIEGTIKR